LAKQVRGIIGDRLDILIATLGTAKPATFEETMTDDFDGMFAVNVRAPFLLIEQFLPLMCKGRCIISITSSAAPSTSGVLSAYAGMTGAIKTISWLLASRLRPRGIRVNLIALREADAASSNFPTIHASHGLALSRPAERLEQFDDAATVVAALGSNDARFVASETFG
jgi:3-oxoacyl-[acyl-carrier protein] reductase